MSTDQIYRILSEVSRSAEGLIPLELLPIERKALGGGFFLQAPWVVEQVALAIGKDPDLFPDRPIPGPELLALQEQADALALLRSRLERMLRLVTDHHIKVQGEAIGLARGLLLKVEAESQRPSFGDSVRSRLRARMHALLPVLLLMRQRKVTLQGGKRKGAGEKGGVGKLVHAKVQRALFGFQKTIGGNPQAPAAESR